MCLSLLIASALAPSGDLAKPWQALRTWNDHQLVWIHRTGCCPIPFPKSVMVVTSGGVLRKSYRTLWGSPLRTPTASPLLS